ncbi:hypothetical protein BURPSPAST_W0819 [Burkholderia pseudomallei Pasteur 52237]|nr:hypothetical protein BURPSPAST_W0819 [Burkholderia pseudomallei Pasteur 52237]
MHDLARLRVAKRRCLARLMLGEKAQHAARERRLQPQHLQRRDHRVAAERRREPRNARVRVRAGFERRREQAQVRERAVEPRVEKRIARVHARDRAAPLAHRAVHVGQRLAQRAAPGRDARPPRERVAARVRGAHARLDRQIQRHARLRGDRQRVVGAIDGERVGLRLEADPHAALDRVEPVVAQPDRARLDARRRDRATPLAPRAAHFEHVLEVRAERHRQRHLGVARAVVRQRERLVKHIVGKHAHPLDVDHALGRLAAAERRQRTVRQVRGERRVVRARRPRQQRRRAAAEREPPLRQHAHVVDEEAVVAPGDVAERVAHDERVARLQHELAAAHGLLRIGLGRDERGRGRGRLRRLRRLRRLCRLRRRRAGRGATRG